MRNNYFLSKRVFGAMMLLFAVFSLVSLPVFGQSNAGPKINVKGVVVDQNSEPLIGVTIVVDKSTHGTTTDLDGRFVLNDVPAKAYLNVTYIGYKTLKMLPKKNMEIVMKEDVQAIDEVVVVAFGTQKKANVTGAVSQVGSDVFESRPISNVTQALQGTMPGLNVTNSGGGELNKSAAIDVRGVGTIGTGSTAAPLVLIDGFPGGLNSVNPEDIESVSVLKDAASSSIYGSRAPFGVILITTKSAKAGKVSVSYNNNVSFNSPMGVPEKMDPLHYVTIYNEARVNGGLPNYYTQDIIDKVKDRQLGLIGYYTQYSPALGIWQTAKANGDTDWYDVIYKDWSTSHNHSLSLKGGSDKLTYYLSGNFMNREGLLRFGDDNFKRYTLNAKINSKIGKKINLSYNMRWLRTEYDAPSYAVASGGMMYHQILRMSPLELVIDPNGYYTERSQINQLEQGGRHDEISNNTTHTLEFRYSPLKNWNITAQGIMRDNTDYTHNEVLPVYCHNIEGSQYLIKYSPDMSTPGYSEVSESTGHSDYYSANVFSDYSLQLKNHNLKLLAGFNAELNKSRTLGGSRTGLINSNLPTINTATDNDMIRGAFNHWATAGYFARVNYNYKDRYMLEGNIRYDGTSRFKTEKRWNAFPSFSLGWNIAKEGFMKAASEYVNTLKLRTSWGELGNQNTSSLYPFYELMALNINNGSWIVNGNKTNTANPPAMISSLLTWEKVRTLNFGLDWSFFKNRLTGSFDYFVRTTVDMVGPAPQLPSILGTAVPKVNNADLESRGFEFEIGWRDNIKDFSYGIKVNLSDSQQKINKYPNVSGTLSTWRAGQIMGDVWGFETIGIAKTDEEMTEHLLTLPNGGQNRIGTKWQAGDIMYRDLNNDGVIDRGSNTLDDHGDLRIIANTRPRYRYGISLDANWKGIDMALFFQGVGKRDFVPPTESMQGALFWGAVKQQFQVTYLNEHWDYYRGENHPAGANLNAYYPRPIVGTDKNQQAQTRYVQDASYLRLKNVQIGYTLPRSLISKININKLRFYMSCENLFTITKLSPLYDPENLGGSMGSGKSYPLSRVLSFGMNLNL